MKILVIDDQPQNIASAHLTLVGHEVTAVDSIQGAYDLRFADFDLILTDLWMPKGDFGGHTYCGEAGSETMVPAGLVLAILAAQCGKKVIICTDSDHHKDVVCTMLDRVHYGKEQMISFVEARCANVDGIWKDGNIVLQKRLWGSDNGPVIKDWQKVIDRAWRS